jgi:integrase
VCALTLDDIDWRAKTLTFRAHKGGKPVMHALTASVASVIAQYLQHERPDSETTRVFLRARPPHEPLGPSAVTQVVYTFLRRAGVESLPRGPHALRHAFAERLLRAGQPLKSIADLLGHRSLSAVSIYAKVDMPRLLEVAMEWPEASP